MKSTLLLSLLLSIFAFSPANASSDGDLNTYRDIYSQISSMTGLYQGTSDEGKACSLQIMTYPYYLGVTYAFIINYGSGLESGDKSVYMFTQDSLANAKIRKISKTGNNFYIDAKFKSYNQYSPDKYGKVKFTLGSSGKWDASIEQGRAVFFGSKEAVTRNCSGQMK